MNEECTYLANFWDVCKRRIGWHWGLLRRNIKSSKSGQRDMLWVVTLLRDYLISPSKSFSRLGFLPSFESTGAASTGCFQVCKWKLITFSLNTTLSLSLFFILSLPLSLHPCYFISFSLSLSNFSNLKIRTNSEIYPSPENIEDLSNWWRSSSHNVTLRRNFSDGTSNRKAR